MSHPALMRSLADRLHEQAKADADDRELTSRTDRRRQENAREGELKDLAVRLVRLKRRQLDRLAFGEELLNAILLAQSIKSANARNRQVSVVRQHLRDMGPAVEDLVERLDALDRGVAPSGTGAVAAGPAADATTAGPVAVSWGERLLVEGDAALEEFMQQHPNADRQLLRQRTRAVAKARQLPDGAGLERAQVRLRQDLERFLANRSE